VKSKWPKKCVTGRVLCVGGGGATTPQSRVEDGAEGDEDLDGVSGDAASSEVHIPRRP